MSNHVFSSLNAVKGTHINEIEQTLAILSLYTSSQLRKGKKGVVINKGTEQEFRVKYKTVLRTCNRIQDYFALKGAFSFGICKTCNSWDNSGCTPKTFGKCGGKAKHCYDTCSNHSRAGGGFGL